MKIVQIAAPPRRIGEANGWRAMAAADISRIKGSKGSLEVEQADHS